MKRTSGVYNIYYLNKRIRGKEVDIMKKVFALCFVFVLVAGSVVLHRPDAQVTAASKKTAALKAYNKFLSKSKINWGGTMYKSSSFRFKLKDLDGDKIPELLATCDDTCVADGYARIYTYRKGKVKEVLTAGHGSFTFYPSKHMVCFSGAKAGNYWTNWYRISNGKVKLLAEEKGMDRVVDTDSDDLEVVTNYKYYVNKKKVTKAKYTKYVSKLKGKEFKMTYMKNTKQNRKKYLK